MRPPRALRALAVLGAAFALLLPGAAHAAPGYEGAELTLTVDEASKDPGDTVVLAAAEGCEPETDVEVTFDDEVVANVTSSTEGGFAAEFDLAADEEAGTYDIVATCGSFSDTAQIVVLDREVFTDTVPNAFYEEAVAWAYARGVTTGVGGSNQFAPNASATRGETVTFLWRLVGQPTGSPDAGFDDTIPNAFYDQAVDWARANGVTTGVGGSNDFEPDRAVTRGEFVTFLWRTVGQPGGSPPAGFDDTVPGAFYEQAVNWAKANNITTGVAGSNRFEPNRDVTRGEVVTFMHRAALEAEGALGPATIDASGISAVVDRRSSADASSGGVLQNDPLLQAAVLGLALAGVVSLQARKRSILRRTR